MSSDVELLDGAGIALARRAARFSLHAAMALLFLGEPVAAQQVPNPMSRDGLNAQLPQARNNIVFSPPVCEGVGGIDGAMALGSDTFTSATAGTSTRPFTSGKVGEPITIEKAGGPQKFAFGALAAADRGTGYQVGDTIPLLGGTGTPANVKVYMVQPVSATVAVGGSGGTDGVQDVTGASFSGVFNDPFRASVQVTGGTITNVISITHNGRYSTVINPANEPVIGAGLVGAKLNVVMSAYVVYGDPGSLGAYTVPPVNPVLTGTSSPTGGTGAKITATWTGLNLSTTIKEIVNATTVKVNGTAATAVTGATWGYGPDYSAQIQDNLVNGVELPIGNCTHTQTIALNSRQSLVGQGAGSSGRQATTLMYVGAPGVPQLKLDLGVVASGLVLGRFNLDGRCASSIGAYLRGISDSDVLPISAQFQTDAGIDISSYNAEVQGNTFQSLRGAMSNSCSARADGVRIGAIDGGAGNVNHNHFKMIRATHNDGRGLVFGNTDSNVVDMDFEQRLPTGTGYSLELLGGMTLPGARSNIFHWSEPQGGSVARGIGYTYPSINNTITINSESGALSLVEELGARVCRGSNAGYHVGCPTRMIDKPLGWTVQAGESDAHYTVFEDARAIAVMTLPAVANGLDYCFTPVSTFNQTVTAQAGEVIRVGERATAAGGTVTVVAPNATWCIRGIEGVWQTISLSGSVIVNGVTMRGGIDYSALPASGGAGGTYVCVDTAGTLYKKASCP